MGVLWNTRLGGQSRDSSNRDARSDARGICPDPHAGLSDLSRRVYEPTQPAPRTRGTHVERHASGSGGVSPVNDTPLLRLAGARPVSAAQRA